MPDIIHIDYETYSPADLKDVGAYRYAADQGAHIIMAAIALNDEEPRMLFPLDTLIAFGWRQDETALEWLEIATGYNDTLVYAHNAQFEMAITKYRFSDLGMKTPIPLYKWRCTAAMARRAALPASLGEIAATLMVENQKDKRGSDLIQRFSIPEKFTGTRTMPWEHKEEFIAFIDYCKQDVRTERDVHKALAQFEFKDILLRGWNADKTINDRGVPVNVPALKQTKTILETTKQVDGSRFFELTGVNHTQREKVKAWLQARGYGYDDMQSVSMDEAEDSIETWCKDAQTKEAFHLYRDLSYAATGKIQTMLDCDCGDGRVRGTLVFHGAGPGRWSGSLIQPQNFKRPTYPYTDAAYAAICAGAGYDEIDMLYGAPMDVISSSIRHYIQLPQGMYDADYSSVEARGVCWLAGQTDAIERYKKFDSTGSKEHEAYTQMAQVIFRRDWKDITKDQRWLGKQTVLGCGYQMGPEKFFSQCNANAKKFGISGLAVTMELAQEAVIKFRYQYYKIKQLWYDVDAAARMAIEKPGSLFRAGKLSFFVTKAAGGISFLAMRLPSSRTIVYPMPALEEDQKTGKRDITYFGLIKGRTWGRVKTYGGKLTENATQGMCGDFMMNGAANALDDGFDVFLLIHDQALAAFDGRPVERFCESLTRLPNWAIGFPLVADGKVTPYYKKL